MDRQWSHPERIREGLRSYGRENLSQAFQSDGCSADLFPTGSTSYPLGVIALSAQRFAAQPPRVSAVGCSRVLASRHSPQKIDEDNATHHLYVGKSPDIKMSQGSLVRRALTGNVSGFRRV